MVEEELELTTFRALCSYPNSNFQPFFLFVNKPKFTTTKISKQMGNIQKISPRRGIKPRSPAWQAGILTTILSRIRWMDWFFSYYLIYIPDRWYRRLRCHRCSSWRVCSLQAEIEEKMKVLENSDISWIKKLKLLFPVYWNWTLKVSVLLVQSNSVITNSTGSSIFVRYNREDM